MSDYRWKSNRGFSGIDANALGELVERYERQKGEIKPEDVVREARSHRSPLHNAFEWDDVEAAVSYRIDQARKMLHSLLVVEIVQGEELPQRAVYSVEKVEETNGHHRRQVYATSEKALQEPDLRESVVIKTLKTLRGYRLSYGQFIELKRIWDAIDRVSRDYDL